MEILEEIRTFTYDANGNLIEDTYETDWDSDGFIDDMTQDIYEYDDAGNLLYEESNSNLDENGNFSESSSNTYNSDGEVIDSTSTSSGYKIIEQYDDAGNLTYESYESDWDGDGIADEITSYGYEYDEDGNIISLVYESEEYGSVTAMSNDTFEYDENGNLLFYMTQSDSDGDGVLDSVNSTTYNSEGDIIETSIQLIMVHLFINMTMLEIRHMKTLPLIGMVMVFLMNLGLALMNMTQMEIRYRTPMKKTTMETVLLMNIPLICILLKVKYLNLLQVVGEIPICHNMMKMGTRSITVLPLTGMVMVS